MRSTIRDVARVAGVSAKTVSNVINDHPHVRTEVRDRVRSAIIEVGYRPNLSARGLRSGRTGVIGLAVPALRENYFAELADAVIRAAEKRRLSVLVGQTNGDRLKELDVVKGTLLQGTDGVLLSPVRLGQRDVDALNVPLPLVLLGERIFGGPTDHVTMHNVSSARAAVEHLIARGRTRIALIGAPQQADSKQGGQEPSSASLRLHGYRQALEAAGVPEAPELICATGPWGREAGAAAVRRLIAERVPFDAVFALNDTLGLGALRALGEAGTRVPDEVAVIGFDNIDETRFSVPSLSSVDPGRESIAEMAVEMLVERIRETGERRPPRLAKPDFHIVTRESSGTLTD
ncbi:LacI family DNA-binding transcriptional regulator [Mycetocola zhujimingii]|uniref:LacI family DNA-binding transcriptional regulator n=1 Tax=Mycetocola zhujimingii TaxID=2079792 RepID=UPI000D3CBB17|nr:LacI family DNA-binding transcriptional regulator [Mycetocola zhujimingii]AWB87636.1 LacI family transcriptional regulator [Mycetocola zhujimingii]